MWIGTLIDNDLLDKFEYEFDVGCRRCQQLIQPKLNRQDDAVESQTKKVSIV